MTTFNAFLTHLLAEKRHMPPAEYAAISAAAKARLTAQWQTGRASMLLDFSDLAARVEDAVSPRC